MKRFGKLAGFFLASLIVCLAGAVVAAELSSATWYRAGSQYGRSDGIFQHRVNNNLVPVINGVQAGPSLTKGFHIDFTAFGDGGDVLRQFDYTAVDLSDTVENVLLTPDNHEIRFVCEQDCTIPPDMDAGSLDIGCDQVDNDGIELSMMQFGASGGEVGFIVSEDAAFMTCATASIEDVSGVDDFHVGFRLQGATNDAFDDYNTLASIGVISGNVTIETILNGGATTTTDTGFDYGDAETAREYCVFVSAAGVASFTYNGVSVASSATFTFSDDADELVPFIYTIHAANLGGEIDITNWEAGYQ